MQGKVFSLKSYHSVFPFLKDNEMLISAWIAPPHMLNHVSHNFNTLEQYRKINQLGLNTIYGLYETVQFHKDEVLKALSYANCESIHYIARDSRLISEDFIINHESEIREMIQLGIKGFLVSDEPGIEDFQQLSQSYKTFIDKFPRQLYYINLMPLHATSAQLTYGAWKFDQKVSKEIDAQSYYKRYAETINTPYISYDFYPFEHEYPHIREDYFKQLELIKEIATTYELIPICFIQTCSFGKHVRIPKAHEILWQVNTSIAYGTKGIQYFTYFLPENNEYEQFKGALIDHQGNETDLYKAVTQINQWLKKIQHMIINSKVCNITQEKDRIIAQIENQNQRFDFMVNISLDDQLILNFEQDLDIISMNTQLKSNSYTLSPGEAIIIMKEDL